MRKTFVVCLLLLITAAASAQKDSLPETDESILVADVRSTSLSIDLSNPEECEAALKRIHTFKYLEKVSFEGECENDGLKRILLRMSACRNIRSMQFIENDLREPPLLNAFKALSELTITGSSSLDYELLCKSLEGSSVVKLELSDNGLSSVPPSLGKLSRLRALKISGSESINYEELFTVLAKLPMLNSLALPVNYLTELPPNLSSLTALQVLDVSNNVLTELPAAASSLKAVNNLSIQGNLLLNPVKELEKFAANDIRYLALDKEISGDEVESIRKMFPNAQIDFPLETPEVAAKEPAKPVVSSGSLKAVKTEAILSPAYLSYAALFQGISYNFDTLGFEERYLNNNYSNVFQRRPVGGNAGTFYLNHTRAHFVNNPKRFARWFRFPVRVSEFQRNYPEMRAFDGMYWIYDGPLTRRQFNKKFMKRRFHDVRVIFDRNNSEFTIRLKTDEGFEEFRAHPVVSRSQPADLCQKTYGRRFIIYQKGLLKRAGSFRREYKRDRSRYDASYSKVKAYAWKELQLRMSNEEKLMTENEWLQYYDNIIASEKSYLGEAELNPVYFFRMLTLCNYVLNGMNMRSLADGTRNVSADFVDQKTGGKLAVSNVVLINKREKIYSQVQGTLGLAPVPMNLRQFSSIIIIVQLRNGDFGYVSGEEIDRQSTVPGAMWTLRVRTFDKNLQTLSELFSAAGIE